MSNKLRQSLPKKKEIKYCLSKEDWNKMAAALMAAEELFKSAEKVTDEQWHEWTSEMGEKQGFPAIIYHDIPVIVRPMDIPLRKLG